MYRWYHSRILFQFIQISLVKGDEIVTACAQQSNKTVTPRYNVTKYQHLRNVMDVRIAQQIWESWQ